MGSMGITQFVKDRIAVKDRNTERIRVIGMMSLALLSTWNLFVHQGKPRYVAAVGVALFTFLAAWSFTRYRQRYRAVR